MSQPNIVYIHSHDTGRYVQPYGHAIPTPHIQHLAEDGVLFRQAFCAAPTCSPSRAALLTGQYPHQAGMIGLAHRGFPMTDFSHHIVHTLAKAGYGTYLAGIQHVARRPQDIGYDQVLNGTGHDRSPADVAIEFLGSSPRRPFFLDVGFSRTHRLTREGYFHRDGARGDPRYVRPPAPLPDTPRIRRDMADFIESATLLDHSMGQVFDALEAAGLADQTLIICTTDHGIAFPAMKCHLSDHGIGVMLILRGPENGAGAGAFAGGKVIDAMVSHLDLFPTICQMAGIDAPGWLEGSSLLPLALGQADQVHEEIFAEVSYHAAYEPMRCVRTSRWKYIRRFDGRRTPVMPNCDDSLSCSEWLDHGWRQAPLAQEMLFDLVFDPNEAHNLAFDPAAAVTLSDMRGRLERWMRRTDDPLLTGPVPAPADAQVNDPDGLSANEPTRAVGPGTCD